MSRIGNKPIVIPEGIEVKIQDSEIIVKVKELYTVFIVH